MLELLDVVAGEAVMVGDTIEDDVHGAKAIGMRASSSTAKGATGDARSTRNWAG